MRSYLKNTKVEDFIINVRPSVDKNKRWTGEINVAIMTDEKNFLTDDDYHGLMAFCKVICCAIPAIEEDEYVREYLENKMEEHDKEESVAKPKAKIVDKHDNVVVLSFDSETKGSS